MAGGTNRALSGGNLRAMPPPALDAALRYAALGYRVLPLWPGAKRPHGRLVPHGLKEASADPRVLAAWWRADPRAGVGILAPEGVLVLDLDAPEAWSRLRAAFPELGGAPRQRTPRGGVHLFLALPPSAAEGLSVAAGALPGVDLRGLGRAYVVAAPTRLESGAYRWEVPLAAPALLPPAPQGLLEALRPPPPAPPPPLPLTPVSPRRLWGLLQRFAARVAATPVGRRHLTLIRYARAAGGLVPYGLDPLEAEAVLVAAAMAAGLPEKEARAAARWGLEVGQRAPLPLAPPPRRPARPRRRRVKAAPRR